MPEENKDPFKATVNKVAPGFPPASLPTVFADGVVNLAPSPGVVKFYLFRTDPEQSALPEYQNQIFAQVVMPLAGFINVAVFFEKVLGDLQERDLVSTEMVLAARKIISEQK